jgi:hypothetical protein
LWQLANGLFSSNSAPLAHHLLRAHALVDYNDVTATMNAANGALDLNTPVLLRPCVNVWLAFCASDAIVEEH